MISVIEPHFFCQLPCFQLLAGTKKSNGRPSRLRCSVLVGNPMPACVTGDFQQKSNLFRFGPATCSEHFPLAIDKKFCDNNPPVQRPAEKRAGFIMVVERRFWRQASAARPRPLPAQAHPGLINRSETSSGSHKKQRIVASWKNVGVLPRVGICWRVGRRIISFGKNFRIDSIRVADFDLFGQRRRNFLAREQVSTIPAGQGDIIRADHSQNRTRFFLRRN